MEWDAIWRVFAAAIGFGVGGELIRRYRAFKWKRSEMPAHLRNAGFWNDRRILRAEAVALTLILGGPWSIFVLLISAGRPPEVAYLVLLTYPLAIYFFMRGLNSRPF